MLSWNMAAKQVCCRERNSGKSRETKPIKASALTMGSGEFRFRVNDYLLITTVWAVRTLYYIVNLCSNLFLLFYPHLFRVGRRTYNSGIRYLSWIQVISENHLVNMCERIWKLVFYHPCKNKEPIWAMLDAHGCK